MPEDSEILITPEARDRIVKKLEEKRAVLPCPRCSNNSFMLLDGYIAMSVAARSDSLILGGRVIPQVAVVCTNCGFIAHHALGVLDLMELATGSAVATPGSAEATK